jgi:GNAT superfamily N-acetyltransferase
VRRASTDDARSVARLLTTAFSDDPVEQWCLACDDFSGLLELQSARVVEEFVASERLWVVDDLSGVSAWFPPGADLGDDAVDAVVNPVLAARGGSPARRTRFWEWVDDHHPHVAHWYVDLMATDPVRWGTGTGTRLLQHGIEAPDSAGLPTFLITGNPRSVPWYERHGFTVTTCEDAPDGGPPVWFMLHLPPR